MTRTRVLAIVQAGGAGNRMDVLTREIAKPALPFAGVFQLVDFPLSNLAHSGIENVWLSVQYLGSSLEEQVANGRPWDLDRNRGGFRLMMPEEGSGPANEEGFAQGNADELFRLRDQVRAFDPELLLVMSADQVYRFDYTEALATHVANSAECTLVTTQVPPEEAGDHAVVMVDGDDRVTELRYKPDDPSATTIAAEIFVYDPAVLVATLEELHRELSMQSDPGDTGLGDFGDHLLPRLVERGRVFAHALGGYWRDVGLPHKYVAAHREILLDDVGVFGQPGWPILTRQPQRTPARLLDGCRPVDSLISPGCTVAGLVERSVLGPGVVVEPGAVVRDSVLLGDARVRADARLDWVVLDRGCEVGASAMVGAPSAAPVDDDALVLVGRGSRISPDARIPAGARLEPGTTGAPEAGG